MLDGTIIAIVTLLVTVFKDSWDVFQNVKENRKARLDERKASQQALDQSLSTSGPLVQRAYDRDFQIIGSQFHTGDGNHLSGSIYFARF